MMLALEVTDLLSLWFCDVGYCVRCRSPFGFMIVCNNLLVISIGGLFCDGPIVDNRRGGGMDYGNQNVKSILKTGRRSKGEIE